MARAGEGGALQDLGGCAAVVGSLGKSRERVGGRWWWGWIWEDPDEDAGESGGWRLGGSLEIRDLVSV